MTRAPAIFEQPASMIKQINVYEVIIKIMSYVDYFQWQKYTTGRHLDLSLRYC